MNMLIFRCLTKGAIVWRWNAHVNEELLILSNTVGVSFPTLEEALIEPSGHYNVITGQGLYDRLRSGTPVEAQDGIDGR